MAVHPHTRPAQLRAQDPPLPRAPVSCVLGLGPLHDFMAYKFKPPLNIEIVVVPAPDHQARLEAAIELVATAIAERAWAEALAETTAEFEARDLAEAAEAERAASTVQPPKAAATSPSSSPRRRAKKAST